MHINEQHVDIRRIRQYRSRISQWRLDKNVKPNEMRKIVEKRQQRRLIDTDRRELVFKVRGNVVDPTKIDRFMHRYEIPESALYAPSPTVCKLMTTSYPIYN
jgi:hypothetical protein